MLYDKQKIKDFPVTVIRKDKYFLNNCIIIGHALPSSQLQILALQLYTYSNEPFSVEGKSSNSLQKLCV